MNTSLNRSGVLKLYEKFTGRKILERLVELNHSQWLSREELLALQQKKLQRLVEYAYRFIPYYHRIFDQVGFVPGNLMNDPASFRKIPLLTKKVINEHFNELITIDPHQQNHLTRNCTGGSTGHPLIFIQDDNFRDYVTADIHRHIEWTGWKIGECHAYIWGSDYEVTSQKAFRSRLMNWCLNRFIANAFTLCDESMTAFTRKVLQKHPCVLYGYASSLTRYAEFVKANHQDVKFISVISTAEMLYPEQRELIKQTFECPVINLYGTRELGGLACECKEQMGLHISVENVHLEILQAEEPTVTGQTGDIVVTNLNNYGMPFIRYQVGDVGQVGEEACKCGRGLPVLRLLNGRTSDLFKTKEGRTVHGEFFTHLFYDFQQVQQFQVIQESYENIIVSIVAKSQIPSERLAYIEHAIKDVMQSNVGVEFRFVDSISVTPSGKFRFTISKVGNLQ
jgi:phenylacetate-CoA ligase